MISVCSRYNTWNTFRFLADGKFAEPAAQHLGTLDGVASNTTELRCFIVRHLVLKSYRFPLVGEGCVLDLRYQARYWHNQNISP